jgi:hypothetical protein
MSDASVPANKSSLDEIAKDNSTASLMIRLMQADGIGLPGMEAAALIVAADARFNIWVLDEVKPAGLNDAAWMDVLDFVEQIHVRCQAAVSEFGRGGDYQAFVSALSGIAVEFRDAPRALGSRLRIGS